ncbi:hypothetical protein PF010_g9042 [Phytophthora fragariae]|uniref:Uncharacterized protein n=1 Tax=Phytophthora fragariae TaxID=53985 RepID=A0A6G0LDQ0_9STRA|nr:hypothetical protein PF010_g9042 [Phytophthora fragariae]
MAELKKRVDLLMIKMDERVKLLMTKMDIIIGALGIEPASAPDATRKQPQTPPPTSAPTPQTPPPASAPTPQTPPPASPPQNYARSGYGDDEDAGVVVDSENYDSDAGEDAGPGEYVVGKKRATATNGVGKPNAKKRATATNAAEKPDTKKRTTATTPAKKPAFRKLTEKQREYLATVLTSPLHVKKMTTEEVAALCKNPDGVLLLHEQDVLDGDHALHRVRAQRPRKDRQATDPQDGYCDHHQQVEYEDGYPRRGRHGAEKRGDRVQDGARESAQGEPPGRAREGVRGGDQHGGKF